MPFRNLVTFGWRGFFIVVPQKLNVARVNNSRLCLKRGLTLWRASRFARIFASRGEGQTPFQTEPSSP